MDAQTVLNDPEFHGLPNPEKLKVLREVDPEFAGLPIAEQGKVILSLQRPTTSTVPTADAPLNATLDQSGLYDAGEVNSNKLPIDAKDPSKPSLLSNPEAYARQTLMNVPKSAFGVAKGLYDVVWHPVDTVSGIGDLIYGSTVGKLADVPESKAADAFWQTMSNRYGGAEQLQNTLRDDPVGFMADLSTVATGAGGAAKLASLAPKMSKAATFGDIALQAGKAMDPLSQAFSAVGAVAKPVGNVASQVLGKTTTVGADAIKQAFKADPEFLAGIRGDISAHDLAQTAKEEIATFRQMRGDEYRKGLEAVANSTEQLDLNPVLREFEDQRKKFGIGRNAQGDLVFTHKTTLDPSAHADFQNIDGLMKEWAKDTSSRSPLDFDTLKRRLDDFFSPNGNMRAALTPIKQKVKQQILDAVPEYATMTKQYEEATKMLDELNATLSAGSKMEDTTVRKLISSNRDGFERRRDITSQLSEKTGGKDIGSMAAGYSMQQAVPRGLTPYITGAGLLPGLSHAEPLSIAGALLGTGISSPRLVGEVTYKAGQLKKKLAPALDYADKIKAAQAATAASRAKVYTSDEIQAELQRRGLQ